MLRAMPLATLIFITGNPLAARYFAERQVGNDTIAYSDDVSGAGHGTGRV